MEKGKYTREGPKGISKLQRQILVYLNYDNPKTLEEVRTALFLPEFQTWSNKVLLNKSLSRLRKRNLIKSIGRNSRAQHLWIKKNDN